MGTYKQFYSDIASEIKTISADDFLSPRFIYYEMQNIIGDFLKKDQDAKRKLSLVTEGWNEIEGVELEEVPTISCPDIDVRLCERMMRSKKRLPPTFTYTFGNIIKHVASPNFSYFFNQTTPRQWGNIQKLKTKDKNKYYYFFIGGYIYLPIPSNVDLAIENVRIEAYFIDQHEVEKFKSETACNDCKKIDLCKSPLDYDVVCPFYLLDSVKTTLLNRLANIYLKVTPDTYANLNAIDKTSARDKNSN